MYEQKYKILMFIPTLGGGGAERVVVNLLKGLDKKKFIISLVVANIKNEAFLDQVPSEVKLVNLDKNSTKFSIIPLAQVIKKSSPDLIISHMSHANIAVWFALKLSTIPTKIIMTEHSIASKNNKIGKTTRFLMKRIYWRADKIVAVSKGVASDLTSLLKLDRQKVETIYNPIVYPEIYSYSKENIDNHLLINKAVLYIISVGSFKEAKDYPTLLRAFRLVRERIDARLLILGEGPLKMELTRLAQDLGIVDSVEFLGFQQNPYKYMRNADLFVLSSAWEGFGNAIVEAMACGCPVVSTDCMSGPREILGDGEFGLLTPVGNADALAQSMLRILTQPDLAEKLVVLGQRRALDFSVDKIARDYEALFRRVIQAK